MIRVVLSIVSLLFLYSCEDSPEDINRYNTLQSIDRGEYKKALNYLKDCEGFSEDECHLNRGVAYYGLSGYRVETLGIEILSRPENSGNREVLSLFFENLDMEQLQLGIAEYRSIYSDIDSCIYSNYENLTDSQQRVCLAINPILLLEVSQLSDETPSTTAFDISHLIEVKSGIEGLFYDLNSSELIDTISGELSSRERDAVECIERYYSDNLSSLCESFIIEELDWSYTEYPEYKIIYITDGDSYSGFKPTLNSHIALSSGYIELDGTPCSEDAYRELTGECLPKPTGETTADIVENWNSGGAESMALILNIDQNLSSDEKISKLQSELCSGKCVDGNITIDSLLNYFGGGSV